MRCNGRGVASALAVESFLLGLAAPLLVLLLSLLCAHKSQQLHWHPPSLSHTHTHHGSLRLAHDRRDVGRLRARAELAGAARGAHDVPLAIVAVDAAAATHACCCYSGVFSQRATAATTLCAPCAPHPSPSQAKLYPRNWCIEPGHERSFGRIRVQMRKEDGTPINAEVSTRECWQ